MKLHKKIIIFCSGLIILLITGCSPIINKEYMDVEVLITGEYYKPEWEEITLVANIPTTVKHDASYSITVNYAEKTYSFYDADTYSKYSGKVGDTVTGVKEIRTYEDGTVKVRISSLK